MLSDYGDETTTEGRRKVFTSADPSEKGALSFNEFVKEGYWDIWDVN